MRNAVLAMGVLALAACTPKESPPPVVPVGGGDEVVTIAVTGLS